MEGKSTVMPGHDPTDPTCTCEACMIETYAETQGDWETYCLGDEDD